MTSEVLNLILQYIGVTILVFASIAYFIYSYKKKRDAKNEGCSGCQLFEKCQKTSQLKSVCDENKNKSEKNQDKSCIIKNE